MRAFTEPLLELEEFQKIQQALKNSSIQVTGCIDAQKAHFVYAAGKTAKKKLIVTYSELRARELCENYRLFDREVLLYPAKDLIFYSADVQSNLLVQQRIRVLQRLLECEEVTVITTMGGSWIICCYRKCLKSRLRRWKTTAHLTWKCGKVS